jgi:hypothetical protein
MKLPLTGGCICGAIRYEITEAPARVFACHCTDCQRVTGSAFAIGVAVPAGAFHATGKDLRAAAGGVTAEGRIKTHWICPDCGTRISGSPRIGTDPPSYQRIVLGGTLDDTSWLRPTTHVWTRSKQPWIVLPEGDEIFDTVRKL